MKTRTLLTTTVFLLCSIILQAQTTTIPDVNFEQALIDLGIDSDGTINQSVANSDISWITYLYVRSKNINDLTGIEGFISLTKLVCDRNQLTSLDVTQNTSLTYLRCDNNQLTSLDVSSSAALEDLYCSYNQLPSLDVSGNPALTSLNCHYNQLTSLDVTQSTALTSLRCFNNQITSLDVTQNTALTSLICDYNQLTSLDVTQNTALTNLNCHHNQLTSLNVTQNTALTSLCCLSNQLTSLNVSQNTALTHLYCGENQLTSLDVSNHPALDLLQCGNNQLPSLDVSGNPALTRLNCHYNQLTSLDVTQNTSLTQLFCFQNQLIALDVTQNTSLIRLWCDGNQLTSIDVTQNPALDLLYCRNNQLTILNVSNCPALKYLICSFNQLTSLDVSNKPALEYLDCSNNQLTSLDVSGNPALTRLTCRNNQLPSLNVSNSAALEYLFCSSNQLTSLDVSGSAALKYLNCQDNQLPSLDVSSIAALENLYCSNNQLTSLDVSDNSALGHLYCTYNQLTSLNVKNGNNMNMGIWFSARYNPYLSCIQVDDAAWSNANWLNSKDATATYSENCNLPPIAVCQDVTVNADENCEAIVTPEQVDNGSYDPEGDPITFSLDPAGPYPLGETTVTLTVEDSSGETDQCTATISVVDATPPVITTITSSIVMWPANHQYVSFDLTDFVLSVSDNCASLVIDDVNIVKSTSDEPENATGGGDGNTLDDMVIADDCKSIQLRKERNASGNGRVYTVYLELDDGNGNTGTASCQVHVPRNNGGTAIDDGAVYEVLGNCGYKSLSITANENSGSNIELMNYPNPFNNSTTLVFSVSEANTTTLKVYNMMSQEVVVLYDGYAEAGQDYKIVFSAEGLPEGLYICHIQSGNENSTNRMLLVR